ncbi:MAG: hypothetical protein ACO27U_04040 [Ilumatobacteraceae bacterium]|jgi:hypothetical protein
MVERWATGTPRDHGVDDEQAVREEAKDERTMAVTNAGRTENLATITSTVVGLISRVS